MSGAKGSAMGHRLPFAACAGLFALITGFSRGALAWTDMPEGKSAADAPERPPSRNDSNADWRPKLSVNFGSGLVEDNRGWLTGNLRATGGIEPVPVFFVGASYRKIYTIGEDDGYKTYRNTDIVSAVFELHPVSIHPARFFWIDPYLSFEFGHADQGYEDRPDSEVRKQDGVSTTFGAGCTFGMRRISLGPQLTYVRAPEIKRFRSNDDHEYYAVLLEARVDVRF